jgi:motility quorum-sensing regulator/GCU-specific mRNA interferase toxin
VTNLLAENNQVGYIMIVEKGRPHCKLTVVKALVDAGQVRTTRTAREGAASLGFDFDDMLAVIRALTTKDFYKSMTSHDDHRVWQDVYRPTTPAGMVYLKLTVIDDVLVVSFKEL